MSGWSPLARHTLSCEARGVKDPSDNQPTPEDSKCFIWIKQQLNYWRHFLPTLLNPSLPMGHFHFCNFASKAAYWFRNVVFSVQIPFYSIPPKVCHSHVCLEHKSSAVTIKAFENLETIKSTTSVVWDIYCIQVTYFERLKWKEVFFHLLLLNFLENRQNKDRTPPDVIFEVISPQPGACWGILKTRF